MAGYQRRFTGKDQEEPDKQRKKEKGKKRFEEDYDFANDEFYEDFKARTGRKDEKKYKPKGWWDGDEEVYNADG